MDLVNAGTVGFEEVKAAANSPSDFDLKMNLVSRRYGGLSGAAVAEPDDEVDGLIA